MEKITITVKLFAIYQEVYQTSQLNLEFPAHTSVAAVSQKLTVTFFPFYFFLDIPCLTGKFPHR